MAHPRGNAEKESKAKKDPLYKLTISNRPTQCGGNHPCESNLVI
jgi:hypothetical protein